jgi:hypothetical protein
LDEELQAIRDAWDETTGRDTDAAVVQSKDLVDAAPDQFDDVRGLDRDGCVRKLEIYRLNGDEDGEWRVQAWLFATFPMQRIEGRIL